MKGASLCSTRHVREDEFHVELRPQTLNPERGPIQIDLKQEAFEIAGIAVGALRRVRHRHLSRGTCNGTKPAR